MKKIDWSELLTENRIERFREVACKRTDEIVVVLENIYDSHNINAVLRSCDAFGIQNVFIIMPEGFSFKYNPKITISAHKWLDIFFFKDVKECVLRLKDMGFNIFSSHRRKNSLPHYELVKFNGKLALVFGNEKNGVSEDVLKYSDGFFWIPMFGFSESLNISVAAAITISRIREGLERSGEDFLVSERKADKLVQKWILKDTEKYRVDKT